MNHDVRMDFFMVLLFEVFFHLEHVPRCDSSNSSRSGLTIGCELEVTY